MTEVRDADSLELLTALDMVAMYRNGTLSPVDVVQSALRRLERLNPEINAFYSVDHEGALEAARRSETRWQAGAPLSQLDGVPTSDKDSLQAVGHPRHFGSSAFDGLTRPSNSDAPAVARLREAGAVSLGRTTMCDFGLLPSGYSTAFGPTRNPWDTSRTPGGSSSGAAAAVAAGIHPVVVGSDIVGSIRLPASFCGLVGHKPSYGRVPFFFQNSPAVVTGPMARTVEDVANMLTIISRPDARDFTALPYDPVDYAEAIKARPAVRKIGLMLDIGFGPDPDPEVQAIVETRAREMAKRLGAELIEIKSPFGPKDYVAGDQFYRLRCLSQLSQLPEENQKRGEFIYDWTAPVRSMSAVDYHAYADRLIVTRSRAMRLMQDCDYLLLPSVAIPAFDAELPGHDPDEMFAGWSNTFIFNLTEQPSVSVPAGLSGGGLPIGLQIVGPRYDDLGCLKMAWVAEQIWGPFPNSPMAGSAEQGDN